MSASTAKKFDKKKEREGMVNIPADMKYYANSIYKQATEEVKRHTTILVKQACYQLDALLDKMNASKTKVRSVGAEAR